MFTIHTINLKFLTQLNKFNYKENYVQTFQVILILLAYTKLNTSLQKLSSTVIKTAPLIQALINNVNNKTAQKKLFQ